MDPSIRALIITNIAALAIFMLKEVYGLFKDSTKENTRAIRDLTNSLVKLQTQMDNVADDLKAIPELRSDINKLGTRVQTVESNLQHCQDMHTREAKAR